jgi:hypothetical protein
MDLDDVEIPWRNLYERYVGPYHNYENERCFRAFTGVSVYVAEYIYLKYKHPTHFYERLDLLMLLNYCKDYPTEDIGRAMFKLKTRTAYRSRIKKIVEYLNFVMQEIDLDRRYAYLLACSI